VDHERAAMWISERVPLKEQGPGVQETVTISVTEGDEIFVFVDGYESPAAAGPFTLTVTAQP